jgi:hypothetical protein
MKTTTQSLVDEVMKRLKIEPTAPVERVVGAVAHYRSEATRLRVEKQVKLLLAINKYLGG